MTKKTKKKHNYYRKAINGKKTLKKIRKSRKTSNKHSQVTFTKHGYINNNNNNNRRRVNCSPKKKHELNNFTCYTDRSLFKLKELWNQRHPDVILKTNNPKDIHSQLSYLLGNVCRNEVCWLKQKYHFGNVHEDLIDDFAPSHPLSWKKNPTEWLTSVDIMNVMNQYEKAYKCFEFFGPSPIDFDKRKLYGECVWNEICNFNLRDQIKNGKRKFGFIFNTDPHFKDGEHWISLFVDCKAKEITFFDSTGDPIPREIKTLVNRIKNQSEQLKPPISLKYKHTEGKQHQTGNTECGIYCLYFIINMLRDKTNAKMLKATRLPDNFMSQYRHRYFN